MPSEHFVVFTLQYAQLCLAIADKSPCFPSLLSVPEVQWVGANHAHTLPSLLVWPLSMEVPALCASGHLLKKFLGHCCCSQPLLPTLFNPWGALSGRKLCPHSSLFFGQAAMLAKSQHSVPRFSFWEKSLWAPLIIQHFLNLLNY